MKVRALLLTENFKDFALAHVFEQNCEEFAVAATLAQAAAIFGESLDPSGSLPVYNLIVAEVSAGGLTLAEYVRDRIRQNAFLRRPGQHISLVLLDPVGDIASARRALQMGVDEYLLERDMSEERIRAILEQIGAGSLPGAGVAAGVAISDGPIDGVGYSAEAAVSGRLSSVESAIVNCLSAQMGAPMSARNIVSAVMGRELDEESAASLIRPHISRLRSKVEPTPQMPQRVLTVRGKGYMFIS